MENNELVRVITTSGLDKTKEKELLDNFSGYFDIAQEWKQKADALVITSIEQKHEMLMARQGRLFLKEKRVAVEHVRKSLKENALREGQMIDAVAKVITNLIIPIEEDLEKKEKFAEIQEEKRKEELREKRLFELQPYFEFTYSGVDYGTLSELEYQKILSGAKLQLQVKIEAEQKAEADRIAREKEEAEERELIRVENEKLKAEADRREKELAIEREKASAERKAIADEARKVYEEQERKLKSEQEKARVEAEKAAEERKKLEDQLLAEANAKRDAEFRRVAEEKTRQEEQRKLQNAPDKEKLIALASQIETIPLPELNGEEAKMILPAVYEYLCHIAGWIRKKTELL